MTTEKRSTEEGWLALERSLDEDLLRPDAYSDEEISAHIKALGGDPVTIGQRGAELAQRLLDSRRLAWMPAARKQREFMEQITRARTSRAQRRSRPELEEALVAARADSELYPRIEGFWRKRRPEESTDEELAELVEEIESLKLLIASEKSEPTKI